MIEVNTNENELKRNKEIPIVFATNDNYAPYAGVCITSLILNSSKGYFYKIYIFYTELSDDIKSKFLLMKGKNYSVTPINVSSFIDKEINLYENFHFSKEMYYRILIPTILPSYKRVIYLDCDMIALGDISELFNVNLNGKVLGGVKDELHYSSKEYVSHTLKLNPKFYINSGLLVIDCTKFKKQKIKEKCFNLLKTFNVEFRYPDQDIINLACYENIKFLESKWNYIWHYNFPRINRKNLLLSKDDQEKYDKKSKNVNIIHYTSNIKPWNNFNTKYTKIYFDYVRKNKVFRDLIFERYNSIKLKNYITLQTLDVFNNKLVIIGVFNTLEDYLYRNAIYITINNKSRKINFLFNQSIDLRNNCYVQKFFRIEVNLNYLKDKDLNIYFSHGLKSNERLVILTGRNFSIDEKLKSKVFFKYDFQEKVVELCNNSLLIKNNTKYTRRQYEKEITYNLKNLNTPKSKKSLFIRRVYRITKPFIKRDIWFVSDRDNIAGDNGEAFFKYLQKNKPKNTKIYFILRKDSPDYKRLKKIGRVLDPRSNVYKILFLHCKKFISSNLTWEMINPFTLDYIKDLLFDQKKVFLQHGIIKDDLSASYPRFNQGINLFITSAKREYDSILNNPKYCYVKENLALTGLARYDYLENEPKKIIYIIPTWRRNLAFDKNKQQLFYESEFYIRYSSLLLNGKLAKLLEEYGYTLKFVLHELMKPYLKNFKTIDSNIIVVDKELYSEIFKTGSLLITDYSSVAFDFAYLKKPIIYYQFDEETFFNTHTYSKGYFDYKKDGFGMVVNDENTLIQTIRKVLESNCKMQEEYSKRVDEFFEYKDKNNSKRILTAITKFDTKKQSLLKRLRICYKQNGLKYTIKRIFKKLLGG